MQCANQYEENDVEFFSYLLHFLHISHKNIQLLNSIRISRSISILKVCNSIVNQLYFFIHFLFSFLLHKDVLFQNNLINFFLFSRNASFNAHRSINNIDAIKLHITSSKRFWRERANRTICNCYLVSKCICRRKENFSLAGPV